MKKIMLFILTALIGLSFTPENNCSTISMSKNVLSAEQGIYAFVKDFEYDAKFEVISYEWTIVLKQGETLTGTSNSKYFSKNLKNQFNNLKKNDRLYFEKIKVLGPDKTIRKINGISLKII